MTVTAQRKLFTLLTTCAGNPQLIINIIAESLEASDDYKKIKELASQLDKYLVFSRDGKELASRVKLFAEMTLRERNVAGLFSLEALFANIYKDFQNSVSESRKALVCMNFNAVHICDANHYIRVFETKDTHSRLELYSFLEKNNYVQSPLLQTLRDIVLRSIRTSEEYRIMEHLHEYLFLTEEGKKLEVDLKRISATDLEHNETKELLAIQERSFDAMNELTQCAGPYGSIQERTFDAMNGLQGMHKTTVEYPLIRGDIVHVSRETDFVNAYLAARNQEVRAKYIDMLKQYYPDHPLIAQWDSTNKIMVRSKTAIQKYLDSEQFLEENYMLAKNSASWCSDYHSAKNTLLFCIMVSMIPLIFISLTREILFFFCAFIFVASVDIFIGVRYLRIRKEIIERMFTLIKEEAHKEYLQKMQKIVLSLTDDQIRKYVTEDKFQQLCNQIISINGHNS